MTFSDRLKNGLILFDGAMGTQVHQLEPTDAEWNGRAGCPEVLNLTAPEKIQQIHERYLNAGADVVETNTFGASKIVLAEFDLDDRIVDINRIAAQIARQATAKFSTPAQPRFVAGAMGPGTKLITLGQTDFDAMYESYALNARGLLAGGVDLFVIETCQDLLQIKAALLAVEDEMARAGVKLPKIVSLTIETTGTMLVGSEVSAALAALEPFDIDVMGMNCATGPEAMRPYVKQICDFFRGPVIVQPNAGLPQNVDGSMVYALSVDEYRRVLVSFIEDYGVQIVGGCCGTTPDFIAAMAHVLPTLKMAERRPLHKPQLASLFSAADLRQDPAPFFVGERSNTNGSKQFRERLLAEDWDGIVAISRQQERTGAHALDLCVAYTGRDEVRDMREAVVRINSQVDLPIFIDSTDVRVIEEALKLIGGRPVINSVNLEDGPQRANAICRLAKRFGAALIALTIDEKGMAKTVELKVEIAKRLYDIAVQNGLRPQDLIFDALTFTLGSGDESMKDAGINTIDGLRRIKAALPGVHTILGVSNISFGLANHSREILNSVFMHKAVGAGLDAAIVNVSKIVPLHRIEQDDIDKCLDLIENRGDNPLFSFIEHFEKKVGIDRKVEAEEESLPLDEKIKGRVINGNRSGLQEILLEALRENRAEEIINNWLIPAMQVVGELFGAGKMQLPFVLQSAEVMKFAVSVLEPYMEKTEAQEQTSIVLGTVRGDVHDIGKNLVDIILSNNGYKVYNLGIKCEIDTLLQKAAEMNADAIGMSGLLVKSTVVMKENLELMRGRHIDTPVLLGGAALTRGYVEDVCAGISLGPVVYCADAFEGLKMMALIKEGKIREHLAELRSQSTTPAGKPPTVVKQRVLAFDHSIPTPPFWGVRVVRNVDLETVYAYLTESVLFRGRWGYRRGKLSREEYEQLIEAQVRPEFQALKEQCKEKGLLIPQVVYGYFPCNRAGDDVIVFDPQADTELLRFSFPRQVKEPRRSIADFFLPLESGARDILPLQICTVGSRASEETRRLYEANAYKDYLLLHGLSVEAAEALAEYWHQVIRRELHIADQDGAGIEDFIVQKYRGSRYSFGYPACPDLHGNRQIIALLRPQRIGVGITEEDQMTPEQTTSAFIVHHPQAKYFTLE